MHYQMCPQVGAVEFWVHMDLFRLPLLSCSEQGLPPKPCACHPALRRSELSNWSQQYKVSSFQQSRSRLGFLFADLSGP